MKINAYAILLGIFITITGKTYGAAWPACQSETEPGEQQAIALLVEQKLARHSDDPQATLLDAIKNDYPRAIDVVEFLIQHHRVDINAPNTYGRTPLLWAIAKNNEPAALMLINRGANIEARGAQNQTALIKAAAHNLLSVVQTLLEKGADVTAADDDGYTALNFAEITATNELMALEGQNTALAIAELLKMGGMGG